MRFLGRVPFNDATFLGGQSYEGMEISRVEPLIHLVRGQRVLLDEDLARIYGVPAKRINEQVRRNIARFPEDFMFRLTAEESRGLRSRIATLENPGRGKYRKYWPLAFTEQGVAMLSGVLHSERAVEVNVAIMRAFVKLRSALTLDASLAERIEKAEQALKAIDIEQGEHSAHINDLFRHFRRLARPDDT